MVEGVEAAAALFAVVDEDAVIFEVEDGVPTLDIESLELLTV